MPHSLILWPECYLQGFEINSYKAWRSFCDALILKYPCKLNILLLYYFCCNRHSVPLICILFRKKAHHHNTISEKCYIPIQVICYDQPAPISSLHFPLIVLSATSCHSVFLFVSPSLFLFVVFSRHLTLLWVLLC